MMSKAADRSQGRATTSTYWSPLGRGCSFISTRYRFLEENEYSLQGKIIYIIWINWGFEEEGNVWVERCINRDILPWSYWPSLPFPVRFQLPYSRYDWEFESIIWSSKCTRNRTEWTKLISYHIIPFHLSTLSPSSWTISVVLQIDWRNRIDIGLPRNSFSSFYARKRQSGSVALHVI